MVTNSLYLLPIIVFLFSPLIPLIDSGIWNQADQQQHLPPNLDPNSSTTLLQLLPTPQQFNNAILGHHSRWLIINPLIQVKAPFLNGKVDFSMRILGHKISLSLGGDVKQEEKPTGRLVATVELGPNRGKLFGQFQFNAQTAEFSNIVEVQQPLGTENCKLLASVPASTSMPIAASPFVSLLKEAAKSASETSSRGLGIKEVLKSVAKCTEVVFESAAVKAAANALMLQYGGCTIF